MSDRVDEAKRDYNRDISRTRNDSRNTTSKSADSKSAFDKVMEERQIQFQSQLENSSSTATRDAVKAPLSQQERFGKEKEKFQEKLKEKEKDSDEKKTSDSSRSGASRARQAEKKVVQREGSQEKGERGEKGDEGHKGGGEHQGHGGDHSSSHSNQQGGKRDRGLQSSKNNLLESKTQKTEKAAFNIEIAEMKAATAASAKAKSEVPRTLSKAVLDQIVQYSRLMIRTDGDKEMEMQLKEEIFKGLKLRVRLKEGKVMATFITQTEAVRNLFQTQKSEITKALEEKGIVVSSLNVIIS